MWENIKKAIKWKPENSEEWVAMTLYEPCMVNNAGAEAGSTHTLHLL